MHQLFRVSILFLSEIFLIECIPYYFFVNKLQFMAYGYLFQKICLKEKTLYYFHKKIKNFKNSKKKLFVGFWGLFWVGFFGWVF
jgi:hypothetical protein